ncbi:helix-turn-helix domain-containing protein [Microbispora sp. GKU 823]|uniref:helix-turn-helix domain-containing protein n=1 Tax=Microbispora sp. GKU 823 TaxID=1652100 RepID=UPI001C4DE2DD|nr:helix-turn-helix domain-containing protein [Microbispora sp. GKU 823]
MAVTRRSPPARRVVAVLDHLVAAGGRGLGLSALARELGISKPTCLGILTELVAAGYLVRDPATLTYGLGPALIAAGRAARRGFLAGDVARRHLEPLAERYHATCTASASWATRSWCSTRSCRPAPRRSGWASATRSRRPSG